MAPLVACRHDGESAVGDSTIVFQSTENGEWAAYAVDPDGGDPTRVARTDGPSLGFGIPSPDGRALILAGARELRIVRTGKGGATRIASGDPGTATWSPDGRRIVFNGLSAGLSIVDADGRNGRRLTRNIGDRNAAWSPDGKWIAFSREGGGGVIVVDPEGKRRKIVWAEGEYAGSLHWSNDGRRLSFVTGRAKGFLVTVSAATGRTVTRVRGVDPYTPIAWSPDGRWIAYQHNYADLYVMRTDGTGRRRLVANGAQPAWSPDGRSIAYVAASRREGSQLWTVRLEGTGKRRLTDPYPNGGDVNAPAWMRGPIPETPSPYRISVARRADGAVLRSPYPIATLGAAGPRVALAASPRVWTPLWVVSPPLIVWDVVRGTVTRVARFGCYDTATSVVVLRGRVAFDCSGGHAAYYGRAVEIFDIARPRPLSVAYGLASEGCQPSELPGTIAGAGDVLVFSRAPIRCWERMRLPRSLWRVHGKRGRRLLTDPDAGEPTAVADGRIAVERDDGVVTVLHADGSLVGRVDPGVRLAKRHLLDTRSATVGLAGRNLVVLRGGRLMLYDAESLRPLRSWPVRRRAAFAGIADGLVAYVVGPNVHVRRLADGRVAVLRTGGHGVRGRITTAGLFYAVHGRPVPDFEPRPFGRNPARVVFVRRDALLRRLRTSR